MSLLVIGLSRKSAPVEIREKLAHLPEDSQRKVLGENALRFYGLSF